MISQKILGEEEYEQWMEEYKDASASLNNRDRLVQGAIERLENEMDYLGVTGVEGEACALMLCLTRYCCVDKL